MISGTKATGFPPHSLFLAYRVLNKSLLPFKSIHTRMMHYQHDDEPPNPFIIFSTMVES